MTDPALQLSEVTITDLSGEDSFSAALPMGSVYGRATDDGRTFEIQVSGDYYLTMGISATSS